MSHDTIDLLKVLATTALVFAAGTLVMFYVIYLLAQYGANLPLVGSLRLNAPPEMVPLLANNRLFSALAAAIVTASGLALLITSHTIDMALLIAAKAVAVVITALLGIVGGQMIYLRLAENTTQAVAPLMPVFIALAAFLVLSSVLSVYNLRRLGHLRFIVAIAMVLIGPLLLMWL